MRHVAGLVEGKNLQMGVGRGNLKSGRGKERKRRERSGERQKGKERN